MGAYLNKPKTEITSNDCSNDRMTCGASAMQGWRVSMEDAHTCMLDFDNGASFFGVFDGHGGSEVAIYAQKHLAEVFKTTDGYSKGDPKQGLTEAFFKLDEDLITEEGLSELKEIAGDNDEDSDNENEAELLTQEAAMPLRELLERLKGAAADENESDSDIEEEEEEEGESVERQNGNTDNKKDEKPSKSSETSNDKTNGKVKQPENDDKENEEEKEDYFKEIHEDKIEKDVKDTENEEEDNEEEENEVENEDDDSDDDDDDDDNCVVKSDEVGYDSGTTAIVAHVKDDMLTVANVGDSRCVVCRNGIALDMSVDHKPEDIKELSRIQKAGGKVTGEGRVNGGLNLSRALGDHSYKGKADLKAEEQQITAMPDIKQTQLTEADEFMVIACDGIWNVKNSQEVVDFVKKEIKEQKLHNEKVNLSSICEKLFEACIAPDTSGDGSGCDNMSCVVVTFDNIKKPLSGKRKSQDENDNANPDKKTRIDEQ